MRRLLHISALLICSQFVFGQVGIGTDNPDANTVLHLVSTSGNQGLIIPKLSTSDMRSMVSSNPQTGTLVFNTDSNEIYSYDASDSKWYSLTPLKKQLYPGTGGIKEIDNDKDGLIDRLNVRTGFGITPIGGIIMWNGSPNNVPAGWALCDGSNGTPDLRERFIVGAGGTSTGNPSVAGNAYNAGDRAGSNTVALTVANMPAHSHTGTTNNGGDHFVSDQYYSPGCGDGHFSSKSGCWLNRPGTHITLNRYVGPHSHGFTTNSTGSGTAHENRPPYYALAFIMRVL